MWRRLRESAASSSVRRSCPKHSIRGTSPRHPRRPAFAYYSSASGAGLPGRTAAGQNSMPQPEFQDFLHGLGFYIDGQLEIVNDTDTNTIELVRKTFQDDPNDDDGRC